LLDGPLNYNGHGYFVGNWDLSSAMRVYYLHNESFAKCVDDIFFAPLVGYQEIINRTGLDAFAEVRIWDYSTGAVLDPKFEEPDR
jgi:hypothetical protein